MSWNYAELSKLAKKNGGPEELVDLLVESGKKSVYPWVGVAFISGMALTISVKKAINFFKEKQSVNRQALEAAKKEIIWGIKDYDKSHDTENGPEVTGDNEEDN